MAQTAIKHILVLDGVRADETIGALGLITQHPDERSGNPFADSCEPIARKHSLTHRERILPLHRGAVKRWEGKDPASPSDWRQLSEEEASDGPDELARRAIIRHPALRTIDGMQLYCFRQRYPYAPGKEEADPQAQDPNHLEYWVRRLTEQLGAGEKLDAVLIPSNVGPLQYRQLEPFLHQLKNAQPQIQIIRLTTKELQPQPLIDHTLLLPPRELGDKLRDILSVPRLPNRSAEEMAKRNLEEGRLKQLSQGRTPATLSPWFKRLGDPGYTPPGKDENGRGGRG